MNINETSARRLRRAAISSIPSRKAKEEEFNYSNIEDNIDSAELIDNIVKAFNRTEHAIQLAQEVPDDKSIKARDVFSENGEIINE